MNDLTRVLSNACNEKEIKDLFDSSDVDKDGKLTLKEFVHVLLPPDLEI
jgi:Ca2+-binding EF-hand superfamily protein